MHIFNIHNLKIYSRPSSRTPRSQSFQQPELSSQGLLKPQCVSNLCEDLWAY
jgi:hypothetical protein